MTASPLPPPDTHCFDEDTNMDVWSYSAPLVEQIVKQARADLEAENQRLREAMTQLLVVADIAVGMDVDIFGSRREEVLDMWVSARAALESKP